MRMVDSYMGGRVVSIIDVDDGMKEPTKLASQL
jgi:hypothetical protein